MGSVWCTDDSRKEIGRGLMCTMAGERMAISLSVRCSCHGGYEHNVAGGLAMCWQGRTWLNVDDLLGQSGCYKGYQGTSITSGLVLECRDWLDWLCTSHQVDLVWLTWTFWSGGKEYPPLWAFPSGLLRKRWKIVFSRKKEDDRVGSKAVTRPQLRRGRYVVHGESNANWSLDDVDDYGTRSLSDLSTYLTPKHFLYVFLIKYWVLNVIHLVMLLRFILYLTEVRNLNILITYT